MVTAETERPSNALVVMVVPESVNVVLTDPGAAYAAVDASEVPISLVAVTVNE